jgi:hypothetical protein
LDSNTQNYIQTNQIIFENQNNEENQELDDLMKSLIVDSYALSTLSNIVEAESEINNKKLLNNLENDQKEEFLSSSVEILSVEKDKILEINSEKYDTLVPEVVPTTVSSELNHETIEKQVHETLNYILNLIESEKNTCNNNTQQIEPINTSSEQEQADIVQQQLILEYELLKQLEEQKKNLLSKDFPLEINQTSTEPVQTEPQTEINTTKQDLNEINKDQIEESFANPESSPPIEESETINSTTIQITDFQTEWSQLSENEKTLGLIAPRWTPDSESDSCMKCEAKFSFRKRRHHCRACGLLFCSNCCDQKLPLPYKLFKNNTSAIVEINNAEDQNVFSRVCTLCYDTIKQVNNLRMNMAKISTGNPTKAVLKRKPSFQLNDAKNSNGKCWL